MKTGRDGVPPSMARQPLAMLAVGALGVPISLGQLTQSLLP
ncbi:MAG TPA: hypothetical protein VN046_03640 [Stenotrophobium sp.]|nr:hypothetical protein [Stenotrophobium sp.]